MLLVDTLVTFVVVVVVGRRNDCDDSHRHSSRSSSCRRMQGGYGKIANLSSGAISNDLE